MRFCEFGAIEEEVLEVSLQGGNTLMPSSFYIVILLKCYLIFFSLALARLCPKSCLG